MRGSDADRGFNAWRSDSNYLDSRATLREVVSGDDETPIRYEVEGGRPWTMTGRWFGFAGRSRWDRLERARL